MLRFYLQVKLLSLSSSKILFPYHSGALHSFVFIGDSQGREGEGGDGGHLAKSGDILGCHSLKMDCCWHRVGRGQGCQHPALHRTVPTTENCPVPHANNSAESEISMQISGALSWPTIPLSSPLLCKLQLSQPPKLHFLTA